MTGDPGSLLTEELVEAVEGVEGVEGVLSSQVRAGQDPILSSAPVLIVGKLPGWLGGRQQAGWLLTSSS